LQIKIRRTFLGTHMTCREFPVRVRDRMCQFAELNRRERFNVRRTSFQDRNRGGQHLLRKQLNINGDGGLPLVYFML
jgi:hypothetical protein